MKTLIEWNRTRLNETRHWEHVRYACEIPSRGGEHEFVLKSRATGHVFVHIVGRVRAAVLTVAAGFPQALLRLLVVLPRHRRQLRLHLDGQVRLVGTGLLARVPLGLRLLLLARRGSGAPLHALVLGVALQAGHVALCALVAGGPSPRPAPSLPMQGAHGRVGAGGHDHAVGVQVLQRGPVHEDVVAVGHALASPEGHGVGLVHERVLHSHQPLLVGVLQLLLVQDGVHLHPGHTQGQGHAVREPSGVVAARRQGEWVLAIPTSPQWKVYGI